MRLAHLVAASALFTSFAMLGCAAAVDGTEGDPSQASAGALAGGCKYVCPKCKPGEICPKIACREVCHGATKCGPSTCAAGQECCNESCGICTDPGGFCTMEFCAPAEKGHTCVETAMCILGYHWSSTKCACLPDALPKKPGSCATDADCRTFSDYCTGCDCRALSTTEKDPTCSGPGVRCFADPCMSVTAACVAGSCSLVSTTM